LASARPATWPRRLVDVDHLGVGSATPDVAGRGTAGEGVPGDGVGVSGGEGPGDPAAVGVLDGEAGPGVADGGAVTGTVGVGVEEAIAEGAGAGVPDALGVAECDPAADRVPLGDQMDAGTARKPPPR
jgi:hypothetical protein